MKRMKIIFPLVLIVLLLVIIITIWNKNRYSTALTTTSFKDALEISDTQDNCYIVRVQYATGTFFELLTSDYTWETVWLQGDSPKMNFSGVIITRPNRFLIYGNLREITEDDESYKMILNNHYELTADRYEIISPITRDYTYMDHGRLIYPRNRIDGYDLENGDYVEKK